MMRKIELYGRLRDAGLGSAVALDVPKNADARRVPAVSYDCFAPLAEKELARIAASAERRWPVRVAAAHRVGRLTVGELSVAVAAGSAHRAEAFEACRFVIDEIKHRLPVWKKE